MEVIPTDNKFEKQMESLQTEAGRWAMKCSKQSAVVPTRSEMGWRSIKQEIRRKKLTYWLRKMRAIDNRWTKKVATWGTKQPNKCRWTQEVKKGLREIGWEEWMLEKEKPNIQLKRLLRKTENEEWKEQLQETGCTHYYKKEMRKRMKYLQEGRGTKGLLKMRVRDMEKGPEKRNNNCKLCGKEKGEVIEHIILACEENEEIRVETGLKEDINTLEREEMTGMNAVKKILGRTDAQNQYRMKKLVEKWTKTD